MKANHSTKKTILGIFSLSLCSLIIGKTHDFDNHLPDTYKQLW